VIPLQTPTLSDLKRRHAKAQAPSLAAICGTTTALEIDVFIQK
jgi:hypothetical protein